MVKSNPVNINDIPQQLRPTEAEGQISPPVEGAVPVPVVSTAWQNSGLFRSIWGPTGILIKKLPRTYQIWIQSDPEIPSAIEKILDALNIPCPVGDMGGSGDLISSITAVVLFIMAIYNSAKEDMKDGKNQTDTGGPTRITPDYIRGLNKGPDTKRESDSREPTGKTDDKGPEQGK